MKTQTVFFVNSEDKPLRVEHVGWLAHKRENKFDLEEIVYEYWPHPDAPEHGTLKLMTKYHVKTVDEWKPEAAAIKMLYLMQNDLVAHHPECLTDSR